VFNFIVAFFSHVEGNKKRRKIMKMKLKSVNGEREAFNEAFYGFISVHFFLLQKIYDSSLSLRATTHSNNELRNEKVTARANIISFFCFLHK
jgi:hypothetical protein